MAIEIMTWVWKLPLKKNLKYVLLALADYADENGNCYPSIETIAQKCSTTSVSVINTIKELCKYGILKKEKRYENGQRTSNSYCINLKLSKDSLPKETLYKDFLRKEISSVSKETLPNHLYMNRQLTNSRTVSNMRTCVRKRTKSANIYSTAFINFYTTFPRKKDKPRAWKAWKNVNPDENKTDQIMNGLKNYKQEIEIKQTEEKYIKYPATWLNNECWEDDYDLTHTQKSHSKKTTSEQFADNIRQAMREVS